MIICAAVLFNWEPIRCHRHGHWYLAIKTWIDSNRSAEWWKHDWFMNNMKQFLTRKEAFEEAYRDWQIGWEIYSRKDKDLYSEDLY